MTTHRLTLEARELPPDEPGAPPRRFQAFVIDERPLLDWLGPRSKIGVSALADWPGGDCDSAADALAGDRPGQEAEGRTLIEGCALCFDIGCGGITVQVERDGDQVIWKAFRFENGYDDEATDAASFESVGPFRFDYKEITATLHAAAREYGT